MNDKEFDLKLKELEKEHEDLSKKLSTPELISNPQELEQASTRYSYLEKIIPKIKEFRQIETNVKEAENIKETEKDLELVELAKDELDEFNKQKELLKKEILNLAETKQEKSEFQENDIIMEIRAGVGGEEAALFAADLFRMYSGFAQKNGWPFTILSAHPTDLDGLKEIIFGLKGKGVLNKMQYEGGVHRIQRIPETEKSGRIHTSTATVAILPKAREADMKIDSKDLRIDVYRASGPGGQYVNRRESAVRVTHLPTGMMTTSQTARTQLQNKENALAVLKAQLLARKLEKEEESRGAKRIFQIGRAKRSEKIRTYNFPQDRITDHRIKKSWHNIENILAGNLDSIVSALLKNKESDNY